MDLTLWIAFCFGTLSLAIMPGPDNIYVLTESISKGWKQGVGITTGLISGVTIHTTLVATGFSLIVYRYDFAYDIVKYAGTAYLLYLAYQAIKESKTDIEIGKTERNEPYWRLFRRGFLMNVLNPKVTIFFIAFLPQFVSPDGWDPMWQMLVLGLTFMVVSFPVFAGIALVSGKVVLMIQSDRFWAITKWMKVLVLVGLAILLVLSESGQSI